MIYRVVTYDRSTEEMRGNLVIPPNVLGKVKKIAGFEPDDDGLGEYPLDDDRARKVARVLGFRAEPERFFYYVEPYEPPDSGFRERVATAR